MKSKIMLSICGILMATAFAFTGCGGEDLSQSATELNYSVGINAEGKYDETLFYRNDLFNTEAADPGSVYCEEDGYFYIFVTGMKCWRTKDFANYEDMGIAFEPAADGWAYKNFWAPECVYDKTTQKYYLYYSAQASSVYEINEWDSQRIGIAVSDYPQGPYHEWEGERTMPQRDKDGNRVKDKSGNDVMVTETLTRSQFPIDFMQSPVVNQMGLDNFATIDVSPFFDGDDLYLYFSRHMDRNTSDNSIWGVKMIDMVTPDYDTLKCLAEPGKATPSGATNYEGSNSINEGPFMISHISEKPNGDKVKKYYLTYSNYGYASRSYSVATAIADAPLGDFVKLEEKYGQPIHGIDSGFDHVAGTAHHQFVQYGDELFILYHAFTNRSDVSGGRSVAADRVGFMYNEELGYDLIYSNGPTYSLQPLPYVITGYKNLAANSTVTADNVANDTSEKYLTDGRVSIKSVSDSYDFLSEKDSVTITLTFDDEVTVRAIMIYNGRDVYHAFSSIDIIRFDSEEGNYFIKDLAFPEDYIAGTDIRPGGAAVAEFNEIKTNKITIKITKKIAQDKFPEQPSSMGISVSDIVVIGK